jgi:acetolactate synthase-1/2/3 large subunit
MKVPTYLAEFFKQAGTTHLFYQEMMFMRTIREAERIGVRPIIAHSEFAAGYMADGYARVSGKPGVCIAQAIGAPNLAAALHDAYLGCVPLIAITGKKPPAFRYRNAYQDSEHLPVFEALTKFTADVTDPAQLPLMLRQAYREAVSGKPRPVHLDVLGFGAIELEMCEVNEDVFIDKIYTQYPPFRPAAGQEAVAAAAKEIDGAQKPVLVVGRGAIFADAAKAVRDLAAKADIPVIITPDGKCILDENDALWYGVVGGYGMDCANKIAAAADLVIFIGSQTSDQTTLDWTVPAPDTRVVQIDIDGPEIGRNYRNTLALLGDARVVTEQLAEAAGHKKREAWRQEADAFRKDTLDQQAARMAADSAPIDPARLCDEVSKALPADGILVADTGFSAIWTANMLRMKPGQSYLRAAGTLGWSFPASLGAKCAAPDRPVINFTGDGGFYYCLSEMETAMRYGITTVTVVNNNRSLGQIVSPCIGIAYQDDPESCAKRFAFTPVDFAAVARGFGLHAVQVSEPGAIKGALQEALACGKPAVVEVLSGMQEPLPPYIK